MITIAINNIIELSQIGRAKDFFANVSDVQQLPIKDNQVDFDKLMELVKSLGFKPNLYAIYVKATNTTTWVLHYLGESKSSLFRSRLRAHLYKKNERTGAQYENVINALSEGKDVGIKFMSIEPDELRHFYEEHLIAHFREQLHWNKQKGKKK